MKIIAYNRDVRTGKKYSYPSARQPPPPPKLSGRHTTGPDVWRKRGWWECVLLSAIEPQFLGCPTRSLVTILLTELHRFRSSNRPN